MLRQKRLSGSTPVPFVHLALLAAAALLVSNPYGVGPDPDTEGSDATAPAASSGQKGGMTNVRPQAARQARPAPERDDPLAKRDV